MAEFDPQQPGDDESKSPTSGDPESRQWEFSSPFSQSHSQSHSRPCCSGDADCEKPEACEAEFGHDASRDPHRDAGLPRNESFVADWSGMERPSELEPSSYDTPSYGSSSYESPTYDAQHSEQQPEKLWDDLVRSQASESSESGDVARTADETGRPARSGQYWSETGDASSSQAKPSGMGWGDDEASEWAPPARDGERVDAAAQPLDSELTAQERRDDVEWGTPASAQDEWTSVRSEALSAESKSDSLMGGAEAAQPEKKKAARKTTAKKKATAKSKKKTAAKKKPAKKAAKKKTAKKVVKKAPATTEGAPTVTTDQDPERRAA
jgi:hypothetical protein